MSRDCGTCRVCCILPEIPEVDKPRGMVCQHLSLDPGCRSACGIYADRPEMCAAFRCLWLQGPAPEWVSHSRDRPDKVNLMVTRHKTPEEDLDVVGTTTGHHLQVWEMKVGAANSPKGRKLLSRLREPYVVLERKA